MTRESLYRFSLLELIFRKLHNISVTLKMVENVIKNLDSSKASGPDCILNFYPEPPYTIVELCNMCLKESCSPDCWKDSVVIAVFKNVRGWSTAKNYLPVSVFSVVSKVFQKLVSNRIVDHMETYDLFSNFHYGIRSSRSTAYLLAVVSDRIARDFNRPGATRGFRQSLACWSSSQTQVL